jgi:hypothetical protein
MLSRTNKHAWNDSSEPRQRRRFQLVPYTLIFHACDKRRAGLARLFSSRDVDVSKDVRMQMAVLNSCLVLRPQY